jgi:hypothetical protein
MVGMSLLVTLRTSLLLAFKSLPLLLIGFIVFLAFGLGNVSLFIVLLGHIVIVPFITEVLHWCSSGVPSIALLTSNDVSQLIPTPLGSVTTPVNVFPSYWMAHISFFFGYLLSNAVSMYRQEPNLSLIQGASSDAVKKSIQLKIVARKEKAMTLIISTVCFLLLLSVLRMIATGAETFAGVSVAILFLGLAGAGYYVAAEQVGVTNSDVFGIAMQMMSPDSAATKPKTCIYTGRPS